MAMNVQAIPNVSDKINQIRLLTAEIINKEILPHENELWRGRAKGATDPDRARDLREGVKAKVKQAGLWAPHLPDEYGGCGLDFLEHAYMNEVLAYSMGAASLFGVVAPNSGNQKILLKYGTEEQRKKWLVPLTEGKLESGFSMTEPDNAGSDPRSIKTTARREGDVWGAAGVSGDLPLSAMYQGARTLRLADGPDEVHKILIAKNVLKQHHAGEGWDFGN